MIPFYKGISNIIERDGQAELLDIFKKDSSGEVIEGIDWDIAKSNGITKDNLKRIVLPYEFKGEFYDYGTTLKIQKGVLKDVPNLETITAYTDVRFEEGSLEGTSIKHFITNNGSYVFPRGYEPVGGSGNVLYTKWESDVKEVGEYYEYRSSGMRSPVKFPKNSWEIFGGTEGLYLYDEIEEGLVIKGIDKKVTPVGTPGTREENTLRYPREYKGQDVVGIAEGAFENFNFFKKDSKGNEAKSFALLDTSKCRYIGKNAFKGAYIRGFPESIQIPRDIEYIGEGAFDTKNSLTFVMQSRYLEKGVDFVSADFHGGIIKGHELDKRHKLLLSDYSHWFEKNFNDFIIGYSKEMEEEVIGGRPLYITFERMGARGIADDAFKGEPLVNVANIVGISLGDRVFKDTNVENVYVGRGGSWFEPEEQDKGVSIGGQFVYVGEEAFMNTNVKIVHDAGAGPFYGVTKRCFYNTPLHTFNHKTTHTVYEEAFAKTDLKEFVPQTRIRELGRRAFAETKLESFDFGPNLKVIPEEAFRGSKLKNVHIPENIESIEKGAFHDNPGGLVTVDKLLPGDEAVIGEPPKLRGYQFPEGWKFYADVFEYQEITPGEVIISGIKKEEMDKIFGGIPEIFTVPETIDGKKVIGIGDEGGNFTLQGSNIKEVKLPEGLEFIGAELFKNNLIKEVTIPGTVKTVGRSAFETNLLEKVTIKPGVQIIEERAFYENRIKVLELPEGIKILFGDSFSNNALTQIKIGDSLEEIRPESKGNRNPFKDNPGGTIDFTPTDTDDIPLGGKGPTLRGVKLDDVWVFKGNQFIYRDYKDGIEIIGIEKFIGGPITVPDYIDNKKVIRIGDEALKGYEIEVLEISEGVSEIGSKAFYGGSLIEIDIPKSVVSIGEEAFHNNPGGVVKYLGGPTASGGVEIGGYEFEDVWRHKYGIEEFELQYYVDPLGNMPEVEGKKTVEVLGYNKEFIEKVYEGKQPAEVVIPKYTESGHVIASIGHDAFYRPTLDVEVVKVEMPPTILEISQGAFAGNSLEEVELPRDLKWVDVDAFYDNKIDKLEFNESLEIIHHGAFADNNIKKVNFPQSIQAILSDSFKGNEIEEVIIPPNTIGIGSGAFENNPVTRIVIPDNLKVIEEGAFSRTEGGYVLAVLAEGDKGDYGKKGPTLRGYTFEDKWELEDLRKTMFEYTDVDGKKEILGPNEGNVYWNPPMESIVIPDTFLGEPIKSIGENAFLNEGIKKVVLGERLEEIKRRAFKNNNLTSLVIPKSVKEIGPEAFFNNKIGKVVIGDNLVKIGKWGLSVQDVKGQSQLETKMLKGDYLDGVNNLHLRGDIFYKEEWAMNIVNLPKCEGMKGSLRDIDFITLTPEFPNAYTKGFRSFTIHGMEGEETYAPLEVFDEGYKSNYFSVKDFKAYEGATKRLEGTKIIVQTNSRYGGIYTTLDVEEPPETLTIEFKYRKVSGELTSFGGHADPTFRSNTVYVDGEKKNLPANSPTSMFVKDDFEEHHVRVEVDVGSVNKADRFYIQPNRGREEEVEVEVYDIQAYEGKGPLGRYYPHWEDLPNREKVVKASDNMIAYVEPLEDGRFRLRTKGGRWRRKVSFNLMRKWLGKVSSKIEIKNLSKDSVVEYFSDNFGGESINPGESKEVYLKGDYDNDLYMTVGIDVYSKDDDIDIIISEPYLALGEYVPGDIKKEISGNSVKITLEGKEGHSFYVNTPNRDLIENFTEEEHLEARFKMNILKGEFDVTDAFDGSGEHIEISPGDRTIKYPMAKDSDIIVLEKTDDREIEVEACSLSMFKEKYSKKEDTNYAVIKPSKFKEVAWGDGVREKVKDKGVKLISTGTVIKEGYEIRVPDTGAGKTFSSYVKNVTDDKIEIVNGKDTLVLDPSTEGMVVMSGSGEGVTIKSSMPIRMLVDEAYVSEGKLPVPYILENKKGDATEVELLGARPGNEVGVIDPRVKRGSTYTALVTAKNSKSTIKVITLETEKVVREGEEKVFETSGKMKDEHVIKVGVEDE